MSSSAPTKTPERQTGSDFPVFEFINGRHFLHLQCFLYVTLFVVTQYQHCPHIFYLWSCEPAPPLSLSLSLGVPHNKVIWVSCPVILTYTVYAKVHLVTHFNILYRQYIFLSVREKVVRDRLTSGQSNLALLPLEVFPGITFLLTEVQPLIFHAGLLVSLF